MRWLVDTVRGCDARTIALRVLIADMIFKGDPGTRIVLQVHDGVGGAYGRTVQAIVQLPQDAMAQLSSRVGSRITVEGRLLSCDALTRNLYVAEGKLL